MPSFYVPFSGPSGKYLEQLFQAEHFIEDAQFLVAVPEVVFDQALTAIENHNGFLGPRGLKNLIEPIIEHADQRQALINFVSNLPKIRRELGLSVEAFARECEEELQAQAEQWTERLGETDLENLISRVHRIIQPKLGLEKQAKADSVVRRVGASLDEMAIVCDLRPIFDDDRQRVEGMIPITTLKIVALKQDGLPIALELRLSEKQIATLCEESERARRKLAVLKQLLKDKSIELPESTMTTERGINETVSGAV
jgi:hypothetical protein